MGETIEGTNLEERVVLLALARLEDAGETPANAVDIVRRCEDYCSKVEADIVGQLSEADIKRVLNGLAMRSLIDEVNDGRSPVGKGRPRYRLVEDSEAILDALATDPRFGSVFNARTET